MNAREVPRRAKEAAEFLRESLGQLPPVAIVLGSGWDYLLEGCPVAAEVDFDSVSGFRTPGVAGHNGRVLVADTGAGPLLVQDGRLHCYEGYSALEVSFPAWAYSYGGVRVLVMFSAAGGLNPAFVPGDLMIVSDHMMLLGENPLRGLVELKDRAVHHPSGGLYSRRWQDALQDCVPAGARCDRGVYGFVTGPSYETPVEAQFLRIAGCDAVGMSTAPEALTAGYLGMEVGAVCCISNSLLPAPASPPSHESVLSAVRKTARGLGGILDRICAKSGMIV